MPNCSIKDKANLFTFNQWSVGQYLNNLTGFYIQSNLAHATITREYELMGDYSIKITPSSKALAEMDVWSYNEFGKRVAFSAKVFSNKYCQLMVWYHTDEYYSQSCQIPPDSLTSAMVSFNIPSDADIIQYRLRVISNSFDDYAYTSDWFLTVD